MNSPKVSVIMSIYNGEKYIDESVQSILDQTFSDFEFIIVDDGSSDGSNRIIESYAAVDKRIVVLKNEANIGLTKSLNRCLEAAKGEYIARQDADDVSLPERLELQIDYLENHRDVGVLGTAVSIINARGEETERRIPPLTDTEIRWKLLFHNSFYHSSVVFRRELLEKENKRFDESLVFSQDYELWVRLLSDAKGANLEELLVRYRLHDDCISMDLAEEQKEFAVSISLREIKKILHDLRDVETMIDTLRSLYNTKGFVSIETEREIEAYKLFLKILIRFMGLPGVDREKMKDIGRIRIKQIIDSLRIDIGQIKAFFLSGLFFYLLWLDFPYFLICSIRKMRRKARSLLNS